MDGSPSMRGYFGSISGGVHLRALEKLTSSFPGNGVRLNLVQSNFFFEDEPHNGGNSRLLQPKSVSL